MQPSTRWHWRNYHLDGCGYSREEADNDKDQVSIETNAHAIFRDQPSSCRPEVGVRGGAMLHKEYRVVSLKG